MYLELLYFSIWIVRRIFIYLANDAISYQCIYDHVIYRHQIIINRQSMWPKSFNNFLYLYLELFIFKM